METLPDQDLMVGQMTVSFGLSNQPADEVTCYTIFIIMVFIKGFYKPIPDETFHWQ